jgi:hypothetical protein
MTLWREQSGRLLHYGPEPIVGELRKPAGAGIYKPVAFWVSVQGEHDWAAWCESEGWGNLSCVHEVRLRPQADVLHIRTSKQLKSFDKEFGYGGYRKASGTPRQIMWAFLASFYEGVIIAPYQFGHRFDLDWYYGWDCASGAIWDISAIESITLIEDNRDALPSEQNAA